MALFAAFVTAEEKAVKSGPQPGEELAGPFSPLNINGKKAGDKNCLYCSNGANPVAMIFAREPNENLTKLIKKLDRSASAQRIARPLPDYGRRRKYDVLNIPASESGPLSHRLHHCRVETRRAQ
ncbi:MAG: hypothetical protein HC767_04145 [Akkermansiaceae bacterium]|nr:hypothetical protein [Akkermansiaceae bacterium]